MKRQAMSLGDANCSNLVCPAKSQHLIACIVSLLLDGTAKPQASSRSAPLRKGENKTAGIDSAICDGWEARRGRRWGRSRSIIVARRRSVKTVSRTRSRLQATQCRKCVDDIQIRAADCIQQTVGDDMTVLQFRALCCPPIARFLLASDMRG